MFFRSKECYWSTSLKVAFFLHVLTMYHVPAYLGDCSTVWLQDGKIKPSMQCTYYPMSKFLLHGFPCLTARSRPALLWASRAKDSIADNSIERSLSVLRLETAIRCCDMLLQYAARSSRAHYVLKNDRFTSPNNGSNARQSARTTRGPSLMSIHLVHVIHVCTSWSQENVSKRMLIKKEVCSLLASRKVKTTACANQIIAFCLLLFGFLRLRPFRDGQLYATQLSMQMTVSSLKSPR